MTYRIPQEPELRYNRPMKNPAIDRIVSILPLLASRAQHHQDAAHRLEQASQHAHQSSEQFRATLQEITHTLAQQSTLLEHSLEALDDRLASAGQDAEHKLTDLTEQLDEVQTRITTVGGALNEEADQVLSVLEDHLETAETGLTRIAELQADIQQVLMALDAATSQEKGALLQASGELFRVQDQLQDQVHQTVERVQATLDQAFNELEQQLMLVERLLAAATGESIGRAEAACLVEAEQALGGAEEGLSAAMDGLERESDEEGRGVFAQAERVTQRMDEVVRIVEAMRPALDTIMAVLA